MRYCTRCLYPENHPLGITFDAEGVCSGCRVHEEKDQLDWDARFARYKEILLQYKDSNPTGYDCIIPVTGDGDSFFLVHTIKNVVGLNPLLVTYNSQFNTKRGIRNLATLLTEFDCDHLCYTVNPEVCKKVTRLALHEMGDMYWHVLAGQQTFPVQVATKMQIPLICWGVNGWLDQVGMFSHRDEVEMTKKVRKEHALRCRDAEGMLDEKTGISAELMQAFTYPADEQLEKCRVRGVYLGNFIRWDAQKQIEDMVEKYNYETGDQERTFNRYETVNCHHNAGVHDYLKFLKYGYGKVSDHASRDIRLKRLTRAEGIALTEQYENKVPADLPLFLEWLGMTEAEFYACIDKFRDPAMWEQSADGNWTLKDSVAQHKADTGTATVALEKLEDRAYQNTGSREPDEADDKEILMGRAFILNKNNYRAMR